jgi:hypothetical protein
MPYKKMNFYEYFVDNYKEFKAVAILKIYPR